MAGGRKQGGSANGATMPTHAQVKAMIEGKLAATLERKRVTAVSGSNTHTTSGAVFAVTQSIVQGDSLTTRDGNQLVVRRLTLRHYETTGTTSAVQRIILFWDNQSNGVAPGVTDVLAAADLKSGYSTLAFQQRRFHVLLDEYVDTSAAGRVAVVRTHTFNLNHKVFYNGTTDVAGSNGKGSMWLLFISDVTTGTYGYGQDIEFYDA